MTRGETGGRRTTADVRGGQAPTLRTIVDSADVTGTDATTGLTYQIIRPDQLATAPWRTLNTFALTPAPFYDPVFLRAVSGFGRGDLQLMIVRDPAENGMLRAIWPFNTIPLGPVSSLRANVTFSSHYSPTAVPIVAQGEAERTIATALRGFASVAPVLVTPNLPLESALAKTLITTLDAGHFAHTVTGRNDRTVFSGPAVFREYAAAHWSQNRRQRIRKSMRRLSEEGLVDFRIASAANPWPGVAEAFLALEHRGWKGRAGTALAAQQESRRIVSDIASRLVPSGLAEIHALMLGDTPIAMLVLLRLRGHVMTWKIAYDETWAKFSPGHVLFAEVTRRIVARGDNFADSCATDGESLADNYWGQSMPMGMLHASLAHGAAGMLGLGLSAAHAAAFDVARSAYRSLRRRT